MYNPFSLEGKTVLITGASSGIGRAIAIECSKMGAKVIATARNEERLNETLSQMEGTGHSVIIADLCNEEDRSQLIDKIPILDGLVNCAGIVKTVPFSFVNIESLTAVMDVNFTSPVLMTALFAKKKKLSKNSSIVFISALAGIWGAVLGNSIYSASKGAVNGISRNMALDLASKSIRVNSVNPGMIETQLLDAGAITTEQLDEDKKRYPLKRFGKPEEVAYAVVYLLSNASAWVTGSELIIDGGRSIAY
jgi:NAD(P)-dependent dehydrogenase (short-subunit alcohol dehydrogenase family)